MKKSILFFAIIFMVVCVSTVRAQIAGSDHDFSTKGYTSGKICIVCHTPHNADTSVSGAPLWNHEVTSTNPFTLYSSDTLNAVTGQPSGVSKLCLSCHDGTIGVDNFGGSGTNNDKLTGNKNLGTDLSGDHPISFTYDTALASADGGLFDPDTALSGLAGGGTIDDDLLFGGKLECASCHDPHDKTNDDFLIKSNAGSVLCLTCHNK